MIIGICGLGFVGNAVNTFFENRAYEITIYDKYKGINSFDMLLETNVLFICLPTIYSEELGTYNMSEIDNTLDMLYKKDYRGIVVIKSTVLPGYCNSMNDKYKDLAIVANPEFLSAKTAIYDFENQKHIVLGYTKYSKEATRTIENVYRDILGVVVITVVDADEAALIKLGCNSFYAMKIQYFTELYMLCNKLGVSYEKVKNGMLGNGWINKMHTEVPGNDGEISYGGMCLPKDIKALSGYMSSKDIENGVLKSVIEEREKLRKNKM
jgi:nucleotide sugar dehydrogenase